jgi:hypothetical protein
VKSDIYKPDPVKCIEPMVLELVDGTDGTAHGEMDAYVEMRHDGTAKLLGTLRFGVEGFVDEATWTLRYPWQIRTDPTIAFRLPNVKELDPMSVVQIGSVEFAKGAFK